MVPDKRRIDQLNQSTKFFNIRLNCCFEKFLCYFLHHFWNAFMRVSEVSFFNNKKFGIETVVPLLGRPFLLWVTGYKYF